MSLLRNLCKIPPKIPLLKNGSNKIPFGNSIRNYASGNRMKISILGAAGKMGQPLSLMLKQSPLVDELALQDISGTCALGFELGHIDTRCKVYAYTGCAGIKECLQVTLKLQLN